MVALEIVIFTTGSFTFDLRRHVEGWKFKFSREVSLLMQEAM